MTLTDRQTRKMARWNGFPIGYRRFYIAQNGRCAYCAERLTLCSALANRRHVPRAASRDHVVPKSKGGKLHLGNKVLACGVCQNRKADRMPRPCELLFASVVAEIVLALTPEPLRGMYEVRA